MLYRILPVLAATLTLWAGQTPKGLAPGDWQQIRALHEAHQQAAARQADGTIAACNPG